MKSRLDDALLMLEQRKVLDFHRKFGRAVGDQPGDNWNDEKQRRLRAALIFEEACEFVAACGFNPREFIDDVSDVLAAQRGVTTTHNIAPNFPEAVDAIMDISYVTQGAAVTFGVETAPVFDVVHVANMAKAGGAERADGKILKPPGWTPPDIEAALRRQGWKG